MRLAPLVGTSPSATSLENALAAHICRCTGWQTILEAFDRANSEDDPAPATAASTDQVPGSEAARQQTALEWNVPQPCDRRSVEGALEFADDDAPDGALVAVPTVLDLPDAVDAAGMRWVLGDTRSEARERAGHMQGRKSTVEPVPPLPLPEHGTVQLATCWVDSGYLEPDASWCVPGGEPVSPRRFGGAFGGKADSPLPQAAQELAAHIGRPVRTVWAREDVTRYSVKRPPVAASAEVSDGVITVRGTVVAPAAEAFRGIVSQVTNPYALRIDAQWEDVPVPGPPVSAKVRAAGLAELWVLVEAALHEAGADRARLITNPTAAAVLLDTCAPARSGAFAGARVRLNAAGALEHVQVRVAAGQAFDEVMLRSYCIGSVHAALGWVLSESIAVDPDTGEVQTLTIRGLGQLRPKDMPSVEVVVVDDDRPALAASEAVFCAVAGATWNAVTAFTGVRTSVFPLRESPAGRPLRR